MPDRDECRRCASSVDLEGVSSPDADRQDTPRPVPLSPGTGVGGSELARSAPDLVVDGPVVVDDVPTTQDASALEARRLDAETAALAVAAVRTPRGLRHELRLAVEDAAAVWPSAMCPPPVVDAALDLLTLWAGQSSGYGLVLLDLEGVVDRVVDGLVGVHHSRQLVDEVGELVGRAVFGGDA